MMVCISYVSCGGEKPQKTAEQTKAEQLAEFKQIVISAIENHLKRDVSSDPDYGRIVETKRTILNDSVFCGEMRIAIKNVFGAVQQKDGCIFYACKKNNILYMQLWDSHFKLQFDIYDGNVNWNGANLKDPKIYNYVLEYGKQIKQ